MARCDWRFWSHWVDVGEEGDRLAGAARAQVVCTPPTADAFAKHPQTDPHKQDLLRGHDAEVVAVTFSPSGRLLATGQRASAHRDGEQIIVWEYESRKPIYRLSGIEGTVMSIKFSEDDRFLAAFGEGSGNGNDLALWDMQNGSVAQFVKCPKNVTCMCFGPTVVADDTRRIKTPKYSLYTFHSVKVHVHFLEYDLRTMHYAINTQLVKFPSAGLTRTYHACCLAPTPGELVAGTSVGEMMVFNTDNLIYRATLPISTNGILSMVSCRDSIYVGAGDGKLKKLQGNDQYWTITDETALTGRVTSMAVRADQEELICGTDSAIMYSVRVHDLALRVLQEASVSAMRGVSFGTRSDVFAAISATGQVNVIDLSDYSIIATARGPCAASCVHFHGEHRIFTGWSDGGMRVYSAQNGDLIHQIPRCHRGNVTCIQVTHEFIFTGGDDGAMRVWSSKSYELVTQFSEHSKGVTGLCADNIHSNLVHTCSMDRMVITYDLKTGRRANYKSHKDGGYTGMCQRIDSEQELLTPTTDGFVLSWDCDVATPVMALDCGRRMKFLCASLSSGGRFIAVGCEDMAVRIWDLQTGEIVAACLGHSGTIHRVDWSPDEKQVVSAGEDGALCVWNFYLGGMETHRD